MGDHREIEDAVAAVVAGTHDHVVFRASLDPRLWVQVARVEGEDLVMCEAVSDEFVGRHEQLAPGTLERLHTLGWGESPADYTRWEAASTPEERVALAEVVWNTLVEAFGHDRRRPAAVDLVDEG